MYYRLPGLVATGALVVYTAADAGDLQADPGDADAGGHRRLHPVDRHGGGRQHPDLRAHERGATQGQDGRARPIRAGVRPRLAIASATRTSSTLITCGILYFFGQQFGASLIITGFALTLAIGVIVSLFSAIFVTRGLLTAVLSSAGWAHNTGLFGMEIVPDQIGRRRARRADRRAGREGRPRS